MKGGLGRKNADEGRRDDSHECLLGEAEYWFRDSAIRIARRVRPAAPAAPPASRLCFTGVGTETRRARSPIAPTALKTGQCPESCAVARATPSAPWAPPRAAPPANLAPRRAMASSELS